MTACIILGHTRPGGGSAKVNLASKKENDPVIDIILDGQGIKFVRRLLDILCSQDCVYGVIIRTYLVISKNML